MHLRGACQINMTISEVCAGYDEGRLLKNVTSMLLSPSVQQSMFDDGLIPAYQNASVSLALALQPSAKCSA